MAMMYLMLNAQRKNILIGKLKDNKSNTVKIVYLNIPKRL